MGKYPTSRRAVPCACPYCGEIKKSAQGLQAHIRKEHQDSYAEYFELKHSGADFRVHDDEGVMVASEVSGSKKPHPGTIPRTSPELQTAKVEVELLELENKKRKLLSLRELGDNQPKKIPDVSEQSGLGAFTESMRQEVQSRAFGPPDGSKAMSWLEILNSPNLAIILAAVRGALGVKETDGGGIAGLAKEMGFGSLKELFLSTLPKSTSTLSLAGLNLEGVTMDAQTLGAILQYKAAEEQSAADIATRKMMAAGLENLSQVLAPMIAERFGEPASGGIARPSGGPGSFPCSECGAAIHLERPPMPGDKITCPGCQAELEIVEETPTPKKAPRTKVPPRQKAPKQEQTLIRCGSCDQAIDVTGKQIGDALVCPVCQTEAVLTDPDAPLAPGEPKEKGPAFDQAGFRRGGQ